MEANLERFWTQLEAILEPNLVLVDVPRPLTRDDTTTSTWCDNHGGLPVHNFVHWSLHPRPLCFSCTLATYALCFFSASIEMAHLAILTNMEANLERIGTQLEANWDPTTYLDCPSNGIRGDGCDTSHRW